MAVRQAPDNHQCEGSGNDLGYLLDKNPGRVQSFELSFTKAHVPYLGRRVLVVTAALLLDIDPGWCGLDPP